MHCHAVVVLFEVIEEVVEPDAARVVTPDCLNEGGLQVRTVHIAVLSTVVVRDVLGWRAQFEYASVSRVTDFVSRRDAGRFDDLSAHAQKVECVHRVRGDGHASPDLAQLVGLFENHDRNSEVLQRQCGGEAADAATDDRDGITEMFRHYPNLPSAFQSSAGGTTST
jgi:hypothetical protein